jgi:hypothetical protein
MQDTLVASKEHPQSAWSRTKQGGQMPCTPAFKSEADMALQHRRDSSGEDAAQRCCAQVSYLHLEHCFTPSSLLLLAWQRDIETYQQ